MMASWMRQTSLEMTTAMHAEVALLCVCLQENLIRIGLDSDDLDSVKRVLSWMRQTSLATMTTLCVNTC
jgi:hypothetical protein